MQELQVIKLLERSCLNHITTNFDIYKLYSDNNDFKEGFSAMMLSLVKEMISRGHRP